LEFVRFDQPPLSSVAYPAERGERFRLLSSSTMEDARSVHREPHRPQGSAHPWSHVSIVISINAVGNVFNATEANTEESIWLDSRGTVGVRGRGMCSDCQVVRDPFGSRKLGYGMRIFSHVRGQNRRERF
jgi:hypothetical protein